MRNAPPSEGYHRETTTAAQGQKIADRQPDPEGGQGWHAARLDNEPTGESSMLKTAQQDSAPTAPLQDVIHDAWLAGAYEVQISDEGRVFSFLPPDEVREAMGRLVTIEMLAALVARL